MHEILKAHDCISMTAFAELCWNVVVYQCLQADHFHRSLKKKNNACWGCHGVKWWCIKSRHCTGSVLCHICDSTVVWLQNLSCIERITDTNFQYYIFSSNVALDYSIFSWKVIAGNHFQWGDHPVTMIELPFCSHDDLGFENMYLFDTEVGNGKWYLQKGKLNSFQNPESRIQIDVFSYWPIEV